MSNRPLPVLGMILKGYPRISESFISNEILNLENLGFSLHIFSMRRPRESFSHQSVSRIQAPVDYLPETLLAPLALFLRHNAALAAKNPRAYGQAARLCARRLARSRKSATVKHLFQAGYLVHRLWPGSGVTHWHAHFAHSPTSVAMFASLLSGLPFSFFAHAKDIYTQDPRQLREKIQKALFVATCTEYNRRTLLGVAGGGLTPIFRVYHGIDVDLFSPAERESAPKPPYRILTVARLVPKKGLPTVMRALKILRDQGVAFTWTLIGEGDEKEPLLALVKELGLEGLVRCPGTLPHEQVIAHYAKADVFVLGCEIAPNGDRDGIPNVLMEAMAMNVPVAATEVSAIPELVENGKTGLLVPPGNPEALAGAMLRLLTDKGLRQTLTAQARKRVRERFDNKALIRDLADIYARTGTGEKACASCSTRP